MHNTFVIPTLLIMSSASYSACSEEHTPKRQKTVSTPNIELEKSLITQLLNAVDNNDETKVSRLCSTLIAQDAYLGVDTINTIMAHASDSIKKSHEEYDEYNNKIEGKRVKDGLDFVDQKAFLMTQSAYRQYIRRAQTQYRNLSKELRPLLNHREVESIMEAISVTNLESIQKALHQSPSLAFCSINIFFRESFARTYQDSHDTAHSVDILNYARMYPRTEPVTLILNHRKETLSLLTGLPNDTSKIVVAYAAAASDWPPYNE